MKKSITTILSLISLLAFAVAEPPEGRRGPKDGDQEKGRKGHHGPPAPEQHAGRLLEHLDLDDAQKEIAKGLKAENDITREDYKTRTESLMEEMKALHQEDSQDETRLIEIGREMGELRVRQGLLMKHFISNLKVHLNEEQLEKLEAMKERMKKMMGKMGKPRGPRNLMINQRKLTLKSFKKKHDSEPS